MKTLLLILISINCFSQSFVKTDLTTTPKTRTIDGTLNVDSIQEAAQGINLAVGQMFTVNGVPTDCSGAPYGEWIDVTDQTIGLFILYAVLMALLQVAIKNEWHYNNYQLFHVFGAILNVFVICSLLWLPKPDDVFKFILIAITTYWITFDISYNLFNKQAWYHCGGGLLDRLGLFQFVIKIILLILTLWQTIR